LSRSPLANEVILGWLDELGNRHITDARRVAAKAVTALKNHLLAKPAGWSDSDLDIAFAAAVLFRSIHDFTFLVEETIYPEWVSDHDKVERIWCRFCNCRERFEFAQGLAQGPIVDQLSRFLAEIERAFVSTYGHGTYISLTLVIDELVCSICDCDLRGCEHSPGNLYAGRLCRGVARRIRFRESGNVGSLVQVPRDPRCRVWPWQAKNRPCEILYLATFKIDDFMEQDDW